MINSFDDKESGFDISNTTLYHPSGSKLRSADIANLECPRCKKIVRAPVQLISCGCRYCTVCIEAMLADESSLMCPVDSTVFSKKHVRKDKGCVREINLLQVDCLLKCGWRGLLVESESHMRNHCPNTLLQCDLGCGEAFKRSEKEQHSQSCTKQPIQCAYCTTSVTKDELEVHLKSICPEYPIECDYCHIKLPRRADFQHHLDDVCDEYEMDCPFQQLGGCGFKGKKKSMTEHVQRHSTLMFEKVSVLWEKVESLTADRDEMKEILRKKEDEIQEKDNLITRLDERLRNLEKAVRHGHVLPDVVEADGRVGNGYPDKGKIKSKGDSTARSFGHFGERAVTDGGQSGQSGPVVNARQLGGLMENTEANKVQIRQLSQSVQVLQEGMTQQAIAVDEIRLRQDILDVRTTNGSFIWKIPDIRRRYREAIDRRTVSIYSPPYFTSAQGYRMCTRVYLNGDGIGKGTHISVFFVLMKSEHDNLLQWPFKQSVRFTLINQVNQSASITEAFAPDLKSPSFQQPENEMNIASGFPKFAKQSVLQDENFTKGNTIYIKAQVDLSGLAVY